MAAKRQTKFTLGTSFAAGYCEDLGLHPKIVLEALLEDLGIRRYRLVSHWVRIEAVRGTYNFNELDWQIALCSKYSAGVTMCLGIRQPRYPEFHQPAWAKKIGAGAERDAALSQFISTVVERYKGNSTIISWQLENEALNRNFGEGDDFNRARLRSEYALVKRLDSTRPIIMSTSNSWGIPFRAPIPDVIGFSLYRIQHKKAGYKKSPFPVAMYHFRALLIKLIWNRPVIIHELQAEPWGPSSTQELSLEEQNYSMNAETLQNNIEFAIDTGLGYADLWGAEYWYWRKIKHGDDTLWVTAHQLYKQYCATDVA